MEKFLLAKTSAMLRSNLSCKARSSLSTSRNLPMSSDILLIHMRSMFEKDISNRSAMQETSSSGRAPGKSMG
eukprot:4967097-Amphidinium_carterae.1